MHFPRPPFWNRTLFWTNTEGFLKSQTGWVAVSFTYRILLGLASQKAPGSSVSLKFHLGFFPLGRFFESPLPRGNILIKRNITYVYTNRNKQNNCSMLYNRSVRNFRPGNCLAMVIQHVFNFTLFAQEELHFRKLPLPGNVLFLDLGVFIA